MQTLAVCIRSGFAASGLQTSNLELQASNLNSKRNAVLAQVLCISMQSPVYALLAHAIPRDRRLFI